MKSRQPVAITAPARYDVQRPDCERAMGSLWEYLDKEIPPTLWRTIGAHITACAQCHRRMSFDRALLRAVRSSDQSTRAPKQLRALLATRREASPGR